jgi:pimeloyl-ACP methyl ester carboxylesterase
MVIEGIDRARRVTPMTEIILDASGIAISGLLTVPDAPPRAFVLALHGGGLRAEYFHGRVHPDTSFLSLANKLGFVALAIDRPGYGASASALPDGLPLAEQARVTMTAIETFRDARNIDAPLFLLGHSFGMKLALEIAATGDADNLIGVDCSGAGVRYNSGLRSYPGREPGGEVDLTPAERIELFWGPADLYPPGTLDPANMPTATVPPAEATDAAAWPVRFREIAPRIRVPVRYTIADHEQWWDVRPETLSEFASSLASSPRVKIDRQLGAGHNISLGWAARAYHLQVVAFLEECLAGSTNAPTAPIPERAAELVTEDGSRG